MILKIAFVKVYLLKKLVEILEKIVLLFLEKLEIITLLKILVALEENLIIVFTEAPVKTEAKIVI